jgi:hypothetical protein
MELLLEYAKPDAVPSDQKLLELVELQKRARAVLEQDEDIQELKTITQDLLKGEAAKKLLGKFSDGKEQEGDLAKGAFSAGQEKLTKLHQSKAGQDLMKKAQELLTGEGANPANVIGEMEKLASDKTQRQEFVTKIKDTLLNHLMKYLPTVDVPKVEGVHDNTQWELDNIDLGGFQVASRDVTVTIVENSVLILANNISVKLDDLRWATKKLTFPYVKSKGAADALTQNVTYVLNLDVLGRETGDPKQMRLGISSNRLVLPSIKLQIKGSKMSFAYNFFIRLFETTVKSKIEKEVNASLSAHSDQLLSGLNSLAAAYLPTLFKIHDKRDQLLQDLGLDLELLAKARQALERERQVGAEPRAQAAEV